MERSPELPPRAFFYTLDQIATMINVDYEYFRRRYIYYDRRSVGVHYPDMLLAVNMAPHGAPPDWRVTEDELKRWFKKKRVRLHQRGWLA